MAEYYRKGVYPSIYISNYNFYRDIDPYVDPGDDPMDTTNILKSGDVPGAT